MRNAFFGGLLVSLACGIVGSFVVVKRIVFVSGGISHASFGGVGLGYFLKINPALGAAVFAVVSALSIGFLSKKTKQREDTAIGILWAVGMGLGILFVALSEGYAPDLMTYLFGNILSITAWDIGMMAALDLVILVSVAVSFKELRAISFDEEFAEARGLPVFGLYLFLLVLTALTVVLLIKAVGIILVIALLTLPAATANRYACTLRGLMSLSVLISAAYITSGLLLSYYLDLPSGATIILVSGAAFLLSSFKTHRV